jgi:hypothetical protein
MRASSGTVRVIRAEHRVEKLKRIYGDSDGLRARPDRSALRQPADAAIRRHAVGHGN